MKYIVILALSLLVGCSTAKDLGKVAVEGAYISTEIGSGNALNTIYSVELTSYEKQVIVHALNYQNQFEEKWKSSIKDPAVLLYRFSELNTDYLVLKSHYLAVEVIVLENWDKYHEVSKFRLSSYQEHADNLDASVANLNKIGDRKQALQEMLYFATTLAQIGIALK